MPEFSVTVTPYEREGSNIKGLARIYFENSFIVNNINIVQGKEKIFVSMPSYKTKALKISAVNDYLNGAGSLDDICLKYGIRSHTQLLKWIQVYNSGGILKTSTGGACMKKAKSTTLDERLKIVMECLANDKNYGAMALKYQCSYQQVRNWVKRYEEMGSKGLEDRRGRRVGSLPSRTPEEELRDRIVELERKNLDLQMENDLLKKVRELERRDHYL